MHRPALLVALTLLVPLALATTTTVHERNTAFLRSLADVEQGTLAQMPDGRILPADAAFAEAALRAGQVDLARTMLTPVAHGQRANWGDTWVLEWGNGPCIRTLETPLPTWNYVGHPQFWMYQGYWGGFETTHGATTTFIGWTTKTSGEYHDTGGHRILGDTDAYCFDLGDGTHFAFPFSNGLVVVDP